MGEIDIDQNLLTFLFLFPFYWGLINQISIFLKMCFDSWILQHCWIRALGWLGNIFHSTIWNQFEKIHKAKKKKSFPEIQVAKKSSPKGSQIWFFNHFLEIFSFLFQFLLRFFIFVFFCLFVRCFFEIKNAYSNTQAREWQNFFHLADFWKPDYSFWSEVEKVQVFRSGLFLRLKILLTWKNQDYGFPGFLNLTGWLFQPFHTS